MSRGAWSGGVSAWGCLVGVAWSGGSAPGGCLVETPPRRLLLWAVRILLECILVCVCERKVAIQRSDVVVSHFVVSLQSSRP